MEQWKKRLYDCYVSSGQVGDISKKKSKLKLANYPYLVNLVKKHLSEDRTIQIADLGCGHGALLFVLSSMGYKNIVGVDISLEQISLAHAMGIKEAVNKELTLFLDEAQQKFDVIFLMDVLEHLTKDEMFELLDRVYLRLNTNGSLIIHVPNADGLHGMRIRYGDLTHETSFNPTSLRQLTYACGFKAIKYVEDVPIVHGFKSLIRFILWRALTIIPRLLLLAETGTRNHVLSQNLLAIVKK